VTTHQNNKNRLRLKKVSGSLNQRRVKKRHRNLKQIFVLSIDSLKERKLRSALTILMVVVGGALMVAINGISVGSAAFMDKQVSGLAPNVMFVSTASKSKTYQESAGFLATTTPRLIFNHQVIRKVKSLPFVKDVVPEFHATAQLRVAGDNVPGSILNIDIGAVNVRALFIIAPTLKLIPGSKIESNNPSAMMVGYDIANPPGYTHNPLIKLGQTVTATYDGTSMNFVVTGILQESGNPNVDRIVRINTDTGNYFFHRLGVYDTLIVMADQGRDVNTVIQEIDRLYGKDSFGIDAPSAIMEAQKNMNGGSISFTLEVGYIALLAGAIGVVTTLWTSVNERTKEIGTMKAIGAKPWFILSMFLSDAVLIGLIGATMGICTGIGLGYILSSIGASEGGHPGAAAGSHITPIFLPNDLLRVWILSLAIAIASGIFPAWKASRLSPLVALRAI
jgi:putative ABC transport system permease protein